MEELRKIWNAYQKQIIIVLVLIGLYLLYNKYGYKLDRLFNPSSSNNSPVAISDTRKVQIQNIAQKIKADIYETPFNGHDYAIYESFLTLFDDEIIFASDYYKNYLTAGGSMYDDLNGEYFMASNVNQRVLDKLTALGQN